MRPEVLPGQRLMDANKDETRRRLAAKHHHILSPITAACVSVTTIYNSLLYSVRPGIFIPCRFMGEMDLFFYLLKLFQIDFLLIKILTGLTAINLFNTFFLQLCDFYFFLMTV